MDTLSLPRARRRRHSLLRIPLPTAPSTTTAPPLDTRNERETRDFGPERLLLSSYTTLPVTSVDLLPLHRARPGERVQSRFPHRMRSTAAREKRTR